MRLLRHLHLLLALAVLGVGTSHVQAQETTNAETLEYRVKAGFLYNFLNFVSWPDETTNATTPWHIGIVDDGRVFDGIAASLEGKSLGDRPIIITRLTADSSLDDIEVIFITRQTRADLTALLAKAQQRPILVIGETPDFARTTGIIGFVQRGANLRLEINIARAQSAGLVVSSRLASLAEVVRSRP